MSWLGIHWRTDDLSRLDAAAASNITAQEGLRQAGEETAHSALEARRQAVMARRQTRLSTRKIKDRRLTTSAVRELVDDFLRQTGQVQSKGPRGDLQ